MCDRLDGLSSLSARPGPSESLGGIGPRLSQTRRQRRPQRPETSGTPRPPPASHRLELGHVEQLVGSAAILGDRPGQREARPSVIVQTPQGSPVRQSGLARLNRDRDGRHVGSLHEVAPLVGCCGTPGKALRGSLDQGPGRAGPYALACGGRGPRWSHVLDARSRRTAAARPALGHAPGATPGTCKTPCRAAATRPSRRPVAPSRSGGRRSNTRAGGSRSSGARSARRLDRHGHGHDRRHRRHLARLVNRQLRLGDLELHLRLGERRGHRDLLRRHTRDRPELGVEPSLEGPGTRSAWRRRSAPAAARSASGRSRARPG